jgi:hypothetical protein
MRYILWIEGWSWRHKATTAVILFNRFYFGEDQLEEVEHDVEMETK